MSLAALHWLMTKAEKAGLRFIPGECEYHRDHANVDDKLYDPRAGLGVFYRWKPRDIALKQARQEAKQSISPALSSQEPATKATEKEAKA